MATNTFKNSLTNVPSCQENTIDSADASENTNNNAVSDGEVEKSHTDFQIPDGGYGWVIVLASFWVNACVWGGTSGFAVILAHYIEYNTYEGGSILEYGSISGLYSGFGLLFAPLVVYFVGHTSVNLAVFLGGLFQFISLFCVSYGTKIYQLYLTQGILSGIALALMGVYTPSITPQWFSKKRSFAMGLCACGSGIGGIIFNLSNQKIIDVKGVEWALRVQAIIVLGIITLCAAALRTRGDIIKPELVIWDRLIGSSFCFWTHTAWCMFTILSYVLIQSVTADATKSLGYSADQGSITSALLATGVVIGRPILGYLADFVGPVTVCVVTYFVCGIFCLAMWLPARNLATMYAFSILEGALMGYIWGAMGATIPKIVGLKRSSVTFGMTWVFIGIASIVSPVIGLRLRRNTAKQFDSSQYRYVAIFAGLSFWVAFFAILLTRAHLIAREEIASKENDAVDSDDDFIVKIRVPAAMVVRNLFKLRTQKPV